jgi:uncharacterized protein YhhL (DUF1145 family)
MKTVEEHVTSSFLWSYLFAAFYLFMPSCRSLYPYLLSAVAFIFLLDTAAALLLGCKEKEECPQQSKEW